ncbi:TetR family transcriptional regulator C-terminal domain-containing protein [Oceanihabitans sp. 2_MG-2023]|uniref:TetR family transcriptional regulator C-terminal domain-containing protein n=1 Tax=Oceanihabitans sp. 2_MG-2023 TaxID=3062661 RepID=UPI0026E24ED9|nr:TetR family transcriptional regulator C-terminal domain-containing protein [Oceanihabitans sp. 2_MG-2023]MDO6596952.1 TetR family transcriptional regulator C-terminal domain-containing protein [Oceanihabitans sp. 2_MG-2023]
MAKKKTIKDSDIISMYMDYVLQNNEEPNSIYQFAKANSFTEGEFYLHYPSFNAVEASIYNAFFQNTIKTLNKSKDYQSFNARNKLLSFYYTFFENLTANRSYVMYSLHKNKNTLKGLKTLSKLKRSFSHFIESIDIETIDIPQKQVQQIQKKIVKESAWLQLLFTMKFWMEDTSISFEKTDVFIEKSVNTSFDVKNITPVKSVMDFGKFLFKEKMHNN